MHGYDHPWPGGGNENLWIPPEAQTYYGVDVSLSGDGGIILSGTPSTSVNLEVPITLKAGTYYLGDFSTGSFPVNDSAKFDISRTNLIVTNRGGGSRTGTLAEDISTTLRIRLNGGFNYAVVVKPMLISGSSAPTTYSPYSNICPISGHTGAEIYHEAEYDADADPAITVTFPETIYGGEDEVISGKLKSTMGIVDLGSLNYTDYGSSIFRCSDIAGLAESGDTMQIISSMFRVDKNLLTNKTNGTMVKSASTAQIYFVYTDAKNAAEMKAAMSGVQLCYELAEPVEYTLTENEIIALDGTNVIWANTGDVTVTYIAKSAKFSFGSPLHNYNYNNLKLFGNTYIEHGKG